MSRRLLIVVVTGLLLLLAVPLLQAGGCGCPDEVDDVDIRFKCDRLEVSWSHESGIGSAILIVDFDTLSVITQQVFDDSSSSVTIDFDPPLKPSVTLSILIIVVDDDADFWVSEFDVNCEPPVETCTDGRLTVGLCQPLVVYPVVSDDGVGWNVYVYLPDSAMGQFMFYVPAEEFDALPDQVAENCTIESSADGEVVLYRLSSGQYQINVGPDHEGKVFVYIFDDLLSRPGNVETYIGGMPPEILPSCQPATDNA